MDPHKIRRLRRNFIIIAMLSFIAVMAFTGGLINLANDLQIRRDMRKLLDYIVENRGDLPEHERASTGISGEAEEEKELHELLGFNSEYRYTTRYYAVLFDPDGDVADVKLNHIRSVNYDEAIESALQIHSFRSGFGSFANSYYFRSADYADGSSIVAVIDATIQAGISQSAIRSTVLVCGAGLFLTFFAVCALSGTMIRPEIENARRQKMFITNASHELKTPLAVIRANTELEELMNGETEWTQSTLRQVDRLNGLVQNLVMIARAQENESLDAVQDIDASAAVLETVRPYTSLALQEGKTLSMDGIVPGLHMTADESRIRQLAAILIDNAFKYCDENGSISVTLSRARIGRQLRLTVSNSYASGKNKDYSRFFERFYREDASRNADGSHDSSDCPCGADAPGNTPFDFGCSSGACGASDAPFSTGTPRDPSGSKGGYGIGLSIAESICSQYRGSIRASWKDGVITFTCLLGA